VSNYFRIISWPFWKTAVSPDFYYPTGLVTRRTKADMTMISFESDMSNIQIYFRNLTII